MGWRQKKAWGAVILATVMMAGCKPRDFSQVRDADRASGADGDSVGIAFNQKLYDLVSHDIAHVTPLMSAKVFDHLYTAWDDAAQQRYQAVAGDAQAKRAFIAQYYGLVMPPASVGRFPMGLTPSGSEGEEVLRSNCLICHAGNVFGKPFVGIGNNTLDFEGFIQDTIATSTQLKEPLTPWLEQFKTAKKYNISFAKTRGTTAPLTFAGIMLSLRHEDLTPRYDASQLASLESKIMGGPFGNILSQKAKEFAARKLLVFNMPDMDLDAPAWWLTATNEKLYNDGLIDKSPRPILQFLADPWAKQSDITSKENQAATFIDLLNHMTPPPTYASMFPEKVDENQAKAGAAVFSEKCAPCHRTDGSTPQDDHHSDTIVPLDVIGTDSFRALNLSAAFRTFLDKSWFGGKGTLHTELEPTGYRAPNLRRVTSSYPYFHNGAVPTLYHVLFPKERPAVWRAMDGQFDHEKLGFLISTDPIPTGISERERRFYFDTRLEGKGNGGHTFIEAISPEKRLQVLEYLKTL